MWTNLRISRVNDVQKTVVLTPAKERHTCRDTLVIAEAGGNGDWSRMGRSFLLELKGKRSESKQW